LVLDGENKLIVPRAGHALLLCGAVVLIVAELKAAQSFFLPVFLAFFVATVSFPITAWLRSRRVPRSIAVLLTVLVDFAFIAGIIVLGVTLVGDLQQKWNEKYAAEVSQQIRAGSESLAATLEKWEVKDAKEKIQLAVENNLANLQNIRFERVWDLGTGL